MELALALSIRFVDRFPSEAAHALYGVGASEAADAIETIPLKSQVLLLDQMSPADASKILMRLPVQAATALLEYAPPHSAVDWLLATGSGQRHELLSDLPEATARDLERLMELPEDVAGQLMDRELTVLQIDMKVSEALDKLRESKPEAVRSLYVVDSSGKLRGVVHIQDLALARGEDEVAEHISTAAPSVDLRSKQDQIVDLLERYGVDSVPVVSANNKLVGVVRYDQLFEAIEDVATADLQTMVGAHPEESPLSPPWMSIRGRLPWLHVNLLTAFLASGVVAIFEGLIAQFTALAILLPVVAGQSGNAGSQALAVTIRGLALGEVGVRQWPRVLRKELIVGLLNGVALAVTCSIGVYLWSSSAGLSLVIGMAMILAMVIAGIFGAFVPILLTRFGQDPAAASSIILTTGTDVGGFLAFLGLAYAFSSFI